MADLTKFNPLQLNDRQRQERERQVRLEQAAEAAQQEWNRQHLHPVRRKLLPPVRNKDATL